MIRFVDKNDKMVYVMTDDGKLMQIVEDKTDEHGFKLVEIPPKQQKAKKKNLATTGLSQDDIAYVTNKKA